MPDATKIKKMLAELNLSDSTSIERYARNLQGMTFQEVLDLGIAPEGYAPKNYANKAYKGGMGNLLEERFFGYRSNSDERPDFPEAGVELKATCYDIRKKDNEPTAGERLVLTMIPFDRDVSCDLFQSHFWYKNQLILLIYYHRDRSISKYDQQIKYVRLFRIPPEDLKIIEEDYHKIIGLIQAGRADELSEGLTTYLGACTKGASEAKMWVTQHYPYIEDDGTLTYRKAKRRAFSFKRPYMDYVLHHYCIDYQYQADGSAVEYNSASLGAHPNGQTSTPFEQQIKQTIANYVGMTDHELLERFKIRGSKGQWASLTYHLLGVGSNQSDVLRKAGISIRAVRTEENWTIEQHLSLDPFDFADLLAEECWEESSLFNYLESTRFFFVIFHKQDGAYRLYDSVFWNMPPSDLNGPVCDCWNRTRQVLSDGIQLRPKRKGDGSLWLERDGNPRIENNLPGPSDNAIAHVRPHTAKRAYRLGDGKIIGDLRHSSELPDGRAMTIQGFWLNKQYIERIVHP